MNVDEPGVAPPQIDQSRDGFASDEAPSPPFDPAAAPSGEPCPTPLAWREVLEAFRAESRPWRLDRPGSILEGRTWGEGPPLYFLCGIGGSYELFALSVWLLRKDFRCVVFNYADVGIGTTRRDIAEYAQDLFAVAELHGDARFSIYATSFGVLVGLTAILADPARVDRAILQGGFAYRKLSLTERLLAAVARRLPGKMSQLPGRALVQRVNHRPWFPPFDESRWQFLDADTGGLSIGTVANRAAMLHNYDLRPRLAEIQQPILLLSSEGEGLVDEKSHRELEHGLPHARTEWLHSCGHLPYLTHPHRTVALIKQFLLDSEVTSPRSETSALETVEHDVRRSS